MKSKNYYKYLDTIRVVFCIAILLYHLNILKGGYLAVCSFFVLSGYLSCISAFKKEHFSLKDYYINRLYKIYLPLVLVVFITIPIVSLFKEIVWLNLKPEVTSILLGYNNYWQLGANLDYFARHINSPFMHLWYVSILLQFDLVFPLIFLLFKQFGDKIKKYLPCGMLLSLSVIMSLYFYDIASGDNMMIAYYDTLARLFSLLFGVLFGFIYSYYKPLIPEKIKGSIISKFIFFMYLFVLIILFVTVDAGNPYFKISMILTTIITCRLIDYGIVINSEKINILDKIIKSLSSISYEVYLIQYPIIFLFQYININDYFKYSLMILTLFILSYILHFSLDKKKKLKALKIILLIVIVGISAVGVFQYVVAKDHTKEMKALEDQLAQNEIMMQKKQEEYEKKLKEESLKFEQMLNELENDESKLKDVVTALPVVGVGDSVMLGATPNLYNTFPNGYFDAKISRTGYVINEIFINLKNSNMLGGPIIINVGANGDCPDFIKDEIMNTLNDKEVFWVNVTNDQEVGVNAHLAEYASNYPNLHIIDWNSISNGHYEYFVADGIHLTEPGRQAYVGAIYDAIYNEYLKEYTLKKEELIKKHDEELKNKIAFYGNDILLNASINIHEKFSEAKIVANGDYTFDLLKESINESIKNNDLSYKLVFMFDSKLSLTQNQYLELIDLCKDHELYFVLANEETSNIFNDINNDSISVIDFYKEIKSHDDYLMADKIHLTTTGNKALSEVLKNNLK